MNVHLVLLLVDCAVVVRHTSFFGHDKISTSPITAILLSSFLATTMALLPFNGELVESYPQ